VGLVELEDLGRRAERAEVDDEDLGLMRGDLPLDLRRRHAVGHQREVVVLTDERGESDLDEIFELADRDCYRLGHCRAGL
jgi:hypothetical protein